MSSKRFQRYKYLLVDRHLDEVADAIECRKYRQALEMAVPLLVVGLGAVGLLVLLLDLLYTSLGLIGTIVTPALVIVVLVASYFENHKSSDGVTATKKPTLEQYITVGNIVKMAAKRVASTLDLSPVYEETDIKAAKDERIVPKGKVWLFKYLIRKISAETIIDTDTAQRVLQRELKMILDAENPAGFDKVRFVYGGVDECILQIDHISQEDSYVFLYCSFASEEFFKLREREREDGENDATNMDDAEF